MPGIAWSKYLISAYLVEILKYIYNKYLISAYLAESPKYISDICLSGRNSKVHIQVNICLSGRNFELYMKVNIWYLIAGSIKEMYRVSKYLISDVCVIFKFSHIYVIVYPYFSIQKFVRTFKISTNLRFDTPWSFLFVIYNYMNNKSYLRSYIVNGLSRGVFKLSFIVNVMARRCPTFYPYISMCLWRKYFLM